MGTLRIRTATVDIPLDVIPAPFRRKAEKPVLIVIFLPGLRRRSALLSVGTLLGFAGLILLARYLIFYVGTDVVDGAVEFVENERHAAFVGRALLLGVLAYAVRQRLEGVEV